MNAGPSVVGELLRDPDNAHFIAYRDGKPCGIQTFIPPTFLSPILVRERMIYLFHGVVAPDLRGGGIGSLLLEHAMGWAREKGHQHCALHFGSPNLSGSRFWLGHGFVPVEQTFVRHVDERIAWSNSCAAATARSAG